MASIPQVASAPFAQLEHMVLETADVLHVQLEPTLQSLVSVTQASALPAPFGIIAQQAAQPKPNVQLVPIAP